MNETIDKFLLADNKFMSEMHLLIVLVDHLLKVKKELKIKKKSLYKTNYFPEPRTRNTKEVELDLANYATKSDLKNATGADTSKLAKKVD